MTQPSSFILASGSPRRRELLASLGIPFEVIKSDIDETQHPDESPFAYVERLSREKADAVAAMIAVSHSRENEVAFVLAADTTVIVAADTAGSLDGAILGKPDDAHEARAMLWRLRSRDHRVCTAMTLLKMQDDQIVARDTQLTTTRVTMRDYSDGEIEAYIMTGDPFDKAGSYAIQHEGFHPVAAIEGSANNVIGLPIETLMTMLDGMGIRYRQPERMP